MKEEEQDPERKGKGKEGRKTRRGESNSGGGERRGGGGEGGKAGV